MKTTTLSLAVFAALAAGPALADHDARGGGHYELRTVQKWQNGYTAQVFVPGVCFGIHVRVCAPGSYQNQYVPGRYVAAQEYVWVDDHGRRGWGWGRFHPHGR